MMKNLSHAKRFQHLGGFFTPIIEITRQDQWHIPANHAIDIINDRLILLDAVAMQQV